MKLLLENVGDEWTMKVLKNPEEPSPTPLQVYAVLSGLVTDFLVQSLTGMDQGYTEARPGPGAGKPQIALPGRDFDFAPDPIKK